MSPAIELTSGQVLVLAVSVFFAIVAAIAIGRYVIKKRSDSDLTTKHKDTVWSSPLEARSKYPEVDVLRHSRTFHLLGLALVMMMLVGLFGWTTYEYEIEIPDFEIELDDDIEIEPPRTAEPPPPPPPPPPPVIQEVPDELIMEDEDDLEFMDQSIDAETTIEAPKAVREEKADAPPPPPPPPPPAEDEIFKVVEDMPRFPGCEGEATTAEKKDCATKKLYEYLYKNIQYPMLARENGIQGNAVISFVVNKDGSIEQIKVLRDPGAGCGDEAMRVINMMNEKGIKWIPGKQRGTAVRVQFILPIKFQLA